MRKFDPRIYWQSQSDMLELFALGTWGEREMTAHWTQSGRHEGRAVPAAEDLPADWSDWLYFSQWRDEFEWWWRRGVLDTGAWSALAAQGDAMRFGRISRNDRIRELTGLGPMALEALAEHGRAYPGSGPIAGLKDRMLAWSDGSSVVLQLRDAVEERFPDGVDMAIVLPSLDVGGAELVGAWHARLARHAGLRVAVILADRPNLSPTHAELADTVVNLPGLAQSEAGTDWNGLAIETRDEVLAHVLEVLAPRVMHLAHSWTGYTALTSTFTAPRIRAACAFIQVSAFCHHLHSSGMYDGYFRYIPRICDLVDRFVFDNEWYLSDIRDRYALPGDRVMTVKYPVPEIAPIDLAGAEGSKTVLWASRLDEQKNPQIVARIAEAMPELDFLMFGSEILNDTRIDWSAMPANVTYGGPFSAFSELPLSGSFAFLYTARFDGTPNILLEMGSRGMPIVAPRICGIPDFLGADWPHYVEDPDDVAGYVARLRALHGDPELRRAAHERVLDIVRTERSFEAFTAAEVPRLKAVMEPGQAARGAPAAPAAEEGA